MELDPSLAYLIPQNPEDLREHYITPDYLKRMRERAREWSDDFIREQHGLFRKTVVSNYPEVLDLLAAELHTRNLNRLHRGIRGKPKRQLVALREKYAPNRTTSKL